MLVVMMKPNQNAEIFWHAVEHRDRQSDGNFVYAVRSTGIYCRPSCASRRPNRHQVVFFSIPEAAEQAGFRACRRCKPNETAIHDPEMALVQRICRYISENPDHNVSLSILSSKLHVSPFHLQRTFKKILGITPRQYLDARRVQSLKANLRKGEQVTHAMYEAGYGSSSRLYEQTASQLGMTPAVYRKRGRGMHIQFTIVDSPLGRLLIGATEKGICAVSMGDSDEALERSLYQEYSGAVIDRESSSFKKWIQPVLERLRGIRTGLDLPIEVIATAFQRRVWEELRRIPYGNTRSYSEIARKIGKPRAARAVARACAANHVALVVPCHRVVRNDGSAGGYRWGIHRKEKLLQQEQS